jgi:hypothetical protein
MAAAASASAKPWICQEKLRLAHAFLQALRSVMHLQDEEATRLVRGAAGLDRFDLAIQRARERREEAKLAYMLHVNLHEC